MVNYILNGKTPVRCDDDIKWAAWMSQNNRRVALTEWGDVKVSTVFLGIDHSFDGGLPILFETMVFGGPDDEACYQAETWEIAERNHRAVCERLFGVMTTEPFTINKFYGDIDTSKLGSKVAETLDPFLKRTDDLVWG